MAASSKVNASVEQVNISSDLHAGDLHTGNENKVLEISGRRAQTDFETMQHQLQVYFIRAKSAARRIASDLTSRMQSLRRDHPGYLVAAAALIGFACGFQLRKRRSRIYE